VAREEPDRIVAGVCPPEEIMTRLRRALGVAHAEEAARLREGARVLMGILEQGT
jgi:hypothetical protein